MQGHRSAIGSLPETLDFDHGSTSSNAAIEQQMCWNNMRNPAEHRLPDYILPPGETSIAYLNSVGHEGQNLSGWNLGEPSSSNTQNEISHDERKTEHGWSSSVSACAGVGPRFGPRLDEQQCEPTTIFALDNNNVNLSTNQIANGPLFMQSSSTDASPQNLNLNAGFADHGSDDCRVMECPNLYKSSGSGNELFMSASSSSDPFGAPSGSRGYLVEENDGRPGCSLEGRRLSCKRKALEGNVGQSSMSGSSRCFQRAETSGWHAVPSRYNAGSSLSISTPSENILGANPSEQVNPRLGLALRGVASDSLPDLRVAGSAENSQRNFRVRISPSRHQNSVPPNLVSTGSAFRHSNVSSPQQPSRLLPVNHTLDLRSTPAADNTNSQSQPVLIHVPALPRNVQSVRWTGGSSSRPGNSSSSVIPGERDAAPREEASLRNVSRSILEHPMFVPATELRNLPQNSTSRSLTGGSISIPGNVASTSRSGSSSGVHQSSAPTWVPHHNPPPQYPRRLSEYVRRSLFSSVGSESGGPSSNYSPLRSGGPAPSQEVVLPTGTNNQGNHPSFPRSAMWMERQGDGVLGIPYSLRTLAAASEGRSRLVSEIRSVLDLMRRGEGLRFEDVMILDQSVFFGVADVHDRHRDMRLDVDNMSYEELLALEERIGNVNTGLSEDAILNRLKQRKYVSIAIGAQLEAEPCSICQEEYNDGEDLGTLECGHDFHSGCIKQWLTLKNLCPICKTTALNGREDN
ncbi:hypothetical protein L1049_026883 [Liquidambar formosana]|uniref:RING-type E3 ubiquitin transferase n=1 Tax=Liquidambar formosana TaxID=63359 RepID=A0AAP0NE64_LIQFO